MSDESKTEVEVLLDEENAAYLDQIDDPDALLESLLSNYSATGSVSAAAALTKIQEGDNGNV